MHPAGNVGAVDTDEGDEVEAVLANFVEDGGLEVEEDGMPMLEGKAALLWNDVADAEGFGVVADEGKDERRGVGEGVATEVDEGYDARLGGMKGPGRNEGLAGGVEKARVVVLVEFDQEWGEFFHSGWVVMVRVLGVWRGRG